MLIRYQAHVVNISHTLKLNLALISWKKRISTIKVQYHRHLN